MKRKRKPKEGNFIVKKCSYCFRTFYAKRRTAKYCSDNCKVQYNKNGNKNQRWYNENPNKGKAIPPDVITSWEMPEDTLVLKGDLQSVYNKLSTLVTAEQLVAEKEYIEKLKPYSETYEWGESSVQIFTDENFIEVFRTAHNEYKLYVWPWDEDNEYPFAP